MLFSYAKSHDHHTFPQATHLSLVSPVPCCVGPRQSRGGEQADSIRPTCWPLISAEWEMHSGINSNLGTSLSHSRDTSLPGWFPACCHRMSDWRISLVPYFNWIIWIYSVCFTSYDFSKSFVFFPLFRFYNLVMIFNPDNISQLATVLL